MAYNAFKGCQQLEEVVLPSTLKKINGGAFQKSGLKEIIIPEGVEEIRYDAFENCKQLEKVTLPSTLKEIKQETFHNTNLEEINIPEGVEYIGHYAFANCEQLKKVKLPSTLREIGSWTFHDTGIKEINIPKGVERVGEGTFCDCEKSEKIIAPKGLYIPDEIHNGIKVERTDERYPGYQENLDKVKEYIKDLLECELNNIQGVSEIFDEINNEAEYNDKDANKIISEMLNLKDSNGNRCFNVFELNDYYKKNIWGVEIDYEYSNKNIKQIIKYSEKLGIKPSLENEPDQLKEQYTEKIETKLQNLSEEYKEAKTHEQENTLVQARDIERG